MKETNDFMKSISLNTILYWIKKENTIVPNGYNIDDGGQG